MGRLLVAVFLSVPLIGAYLMFTLGVVVIYRASRVLNLAHGAMALVPAYLFHSMRQASVPLLPAVLLAVLSGSLLGLLVEWAFVRRLRRQGSTAQTVGALIGVVP
jgi:branched-chain amino acid transport system permease protein